MVEAQVALFWAWAKECNDKFIYLHNKAVGTVFAVI